MFIHNKEQGSSILVTMEVVAVFFFHKGPLGSRGHLGEEP